MVATKVKYIFVVGGVMSGVGKGVSTSSIGATLQAHGYVVTAIKVDLYINVDAGTMNPVEHGEVFVTKDGMETDQDIGNYERFLDRDITSDNYMTTGLVYKTVIERERNLEYEGRCVEVVPHIPEEIIRRIELVAEKSAADFVLVEIGGTAGEYQILLFLEAIRMMKLRDPDQVLLALVSYLPVPSIIGEMKTKPTQRAVRDLNEAGLQPDIIIARSSEPLDEPRKRKISIFCNVKPEDVISAPDIKSSIYEIPFNFERDGISERIFKKLGMRLNKGDFRRWKWLSRRIHGTGKDVTIGIIGKYFDTGEFTLADSYISVIEAIKHAAWHHGANPKIEWISADVYEENSRKLAQLKKLDGIIVPGGFGERGTEGKIRAIQYARENNIPFFGLCYGMQLAVVEFARNVLGWEDAHTTEVVRSTKHPVIDILPEQRVKLEENDYGATMRLGAYHCHVKPKTKARDAYKEEMIEERHRHRYEFNNEFREELESAGLVISGINPDRDLVEIVELKKHPFFMGTQFHPEFQSRPFKAHPLFRDFIGASLKE